MFGKVRSSDYGVVRYQMMSDMVVDCLLVPSGNAESETVFHVFSGYGSVVERVLSRWDAPLFRVASHKIVISNMGLGLVTRYVPSIQYSGDLTRKVPRLFILIFPKEFDDHSDQ